MSELSSVYSEYEQVSNMFRQLNEASLIVRQAMLGVGTPSDEELRLARDQLEEALDKLSWDNGENKDKDEGVTLTELLEQAPDEDEELTKQDISNIRRRIKSGLKALTPDDLEVIDRLSAALDLKSEILFRRIKK
jgi:hypothetical protein